MSTKQKPWRDLLPIHQAAELTPLMSPEQLRELADDIKKNGLREPISISEGDGHDLKFGKKYLMDGRNRMDALALLGFDLFRYKLTGEPTEEIDWRCQIKCGDVTSQIFKVEEVSDPGAFVKSKNLHRLHLNSAEQRRELLLRRLKANPELSNRAIATAAGVDHTTVAKARKKVEATGGIPQLEKTKGKDGKARPARKKTTKGKDGEAGKKTPKSAESAKSAEQPAPEATGSVERAANPDAEASTEARKAAYAAQENGGAAKTAGSTEPPAKASVAPGDIGAARVPPEASAEVREVIKAALGDIGARAIARVMASMAQQVLPRKDLQLIVDHLADCPETERAKLVERLRHVGGELYAWADRIANGSTEPPKPSIEQMKLDTDKRLAERVAERAAEAKAEAEAVAKHKARVEAQAEAKAKAKEARDAAKAAAKGAKAQEPKLKPDPLFAKINAKLKADARARSAYAKPDRLKFHPTPGGAVYSFHVPGLPERDRGGLRLADLEQLAKKIGVVKAKPPIEQPIETPASHAG